MTNHVLNQKQLATAGQLSALGFKFASHLVRLLAEGGLGYDEVNYLIGSKDREFEKFIEKFSEDVFGIKVDPWFEEKRTVERFYQKFFNRKIDWSKFSLPTKTETMKRLGIIFSDITEEQYLKAYIEKFGKGSVSKDCFNLSNIVNQQERPKGDYAFSYISRAEVDLPGKGYNDGINEGVKFMIPKEGIFTASRYRNETGKMYDIKYYTRFAALSNNDNIVSMNCNDNGQLFIGVKFKNYSDALSGLRQVDFVS